MAKTTRVIVRAHRMATLVPLKTKVKHSKKQQNVWKQFRTETNFAGIRYLSGIGYKNRTCWGLWTLLFILCCALFVYSIVDIGWKYLRYNVKTSIFYELDEEIDFPAITLCNENQFKKSVVGGSLTAMTALAILNKPKGSADMSRLVTENNRTCFNNESDVAKEFDKLGAAFFTQKGLSESMRLSTADSYNSVVKCWWNTLEIDCNGHFLNHNTDYGWCFTYNPNTDMILKNLTRRRTIDGYGFDESISQPNILYSSGPRNGLRLLLNTNQSDYCGAFRKYKGAGFLLRVHDPSIIATFELSAHVLLSPGYNYHVAIEPTLWRKETEKLGRCSSSMDSPLYHGTKTFFKEDCLLQCYDVIVMDRCKCLPLNIAKSSFANSTRRSLPVCWGAASECTRGIREAMVDMGINKLCPQCKDLCDFREFKLSVSQSMLAWSSSNFLNENFSTDSSEIGKNFVVVNFYFKDVIVQVIKEMQAVTPLDLFTSIGGKSTLFLGMSVVSFAEVLFNVVLFLHELVRKFNTTVKPIQNRCNKETPLTVFDAANKDLIITYTSRKHHRLSIVSLK